MNLQESAGFMTNSVDIYLIAPLKMSVLGLQEGAGGTINRTNPDPIAP